MCIVLTVLAVAVGLFTGVKFGPEIITFIKKLNK